MKQKMRFEYKNTKLRIPKCSIYIEAEGCPLYVHEREEDKGEKDETII